LSGTKSLTDKFDKHFNNHLLEFVKCTSLVLIVMAFAGNLFHKDFNKIPASYTVLLTIEGSTNAD